MAFGKKKRAAERPASTNQTVSGVVLVNSEGSLVHGACSSLVARAQLLAILEQQNTFEL